MSRGEIVAFPTESSYGLGVDALSSHALERLFALKRREPGKPPPILISDDRMLELLVAHVPPRARELMARFWPGPLTLVLPARPGLPASLVSDGGVGVRRSPHPLADALVAAFGGPVTATSANLSGRPAALAHARRGHRPRLAPRSTCSTAALRRALLLRRWREWTRTAPSRFYVWARSTPRGFEYSFRRMAEIAAFRGILYSSQAGPAGKLLAPPYDVISPDERAKLAALDPHNCVRLILPEGEGDTKYAHAAADLRAWLSEGVLARDAEPALYRYHQTFTALRNATKKATRAPASSAASASGIAFAEGAGAATMRRCCPAADVVKSAALCCAHLCRPGSYSDPARESDVPFAELVKTPPVLDGTTRMGVR